MYAYRDPRSPLPARLVMLIVLAYALSPIDLIPDPIPILGQLDDLILVPLGIALAVRLLPRAVLADARRRAADTPPHDLPLRRLGLPIVVLTWIVALTALTTLGLYLAR